jgi:hypothetical protein
MNVNEIFEKYNTDESLTYEQFVTPSFSGGHNKWINRYPKTNVVFKILERACLKNDIDYNWITDFFGGNVSTYVLGISQQDANKLGKQVSISWDEFTEKYCDDDASETTITADEINTYRKPKLVDYVTVKNLKAQKIPMSTSIYEFINKPLTDGQISISDLQMTVRDFLMNFASFRSISKTQYNIFTSVNGKGGIFGRNGDLKAIEPVEVGEFLFQVSIDELNYKRDVDEIQKLWEWRTGRNELRGKYEEHFGYDVKHMSHLFRLLLGAINILETGEYHPRLKGENLKFVRNILRGQYTYNYLIEYTSVLEEKMEEAYKTSTLPETANHKKANKLLLELSY